MFSWGRRSIRRSINVATKVSILRSKSPRRRRLSGSHPSFWLVPWFRRPARHRSKADDQTHTPNVLSQRSGDRGGRGSAIRARGVAWRREHGWRRSSAHSRPSATARPSTDGHACRLERCGARLAETTAGGQRIGASAADRVDGVMVDWICS